MKPLKPFFSYYGSKWRSIKKYPYPRYNTIIEPFAGSASYSLYYFDWNVILYDLDEHICATWDYLIHVSEREILSLPIIPFDGDLREIPGLTQEQKWLIGWWLGSASSAPRNKPTSKMTSFDFMNKRPNSYWCMQSKIRIASQIEYIRHWVVRKESYIGIPDMSGTYFVDPPYQVEGSKYRFSKIDYEHLSVWCKTRRGQVIVCETNGDWLPFEPLYSNLTAGSGKVSTESVFCIDNPIRVRGVRSK